MTVRELIEKLESYANEYGDDIPVCTFDLDRWVSYIQEVEPCINHNGEFCIYVGE